VFHGPLGQVILDPNGGARDAAGAAAAGAAFRGVAPLLGVKMNEEAR